MKKTMVIMFVLIEMIVALSLLTFVSATEYRIIDPNQKGEAVQIEVMYSVLENKSEVVSIEQLKNEITQIEADIDRITSGVKSQIIELNEQKERKLQLIKNIEANLY